MKSKEGRESVISRVLRTSIDGAYLIITFRKRSLKDKRRVNQARHETIDGAYGSLERHPPGTQCCHPEQSCTEDTRRPAADMRNKTICTSVQTNLVWRIQPLG